MISIVSPVYKAEKILPELVARVSKSLTETGQPFELILIEDRGPDNSWVVIKELATRYPFVKGFRMSRNFGQHAAISAGLAQARGEKIIVMDCDLQDDPKYFRALLEAQSKGFEVVYTIKTSRRHAFVKNVLAVLWHKVFNWLSEGNTVYSHKDIGSFSLITRKVADAYLKLADSRRHYLLLLRWLGFSSTIIEVEHNDRYEGRSSYSLSMMIEHAVSGILSQSNRLLYVSIALGLFFVAGSAAAAIALVILYFVHGFQQGWASQIVITLMCTGIILVMLGVTGAYIGMIFEQVKARPLYVLDDSTLSDPLVAAPTPKPEKWSELS